MYWGLAVWGAAPPGERRPFAQLNPLINIGFMSPFPLQVTLEYRDLVINH